MSLQFPELHSQLEQRPETCPVCLTKTLFSTYQIVLRHFANADKRRATGTKEIHCWDFVLQFCSACRHPLMRVTESSDVAVTRICFPLAHGRSPTPPEVPEPYRSDYNEACLVLPLSAQASAALSRRVLQGLLRGPGKSPPAKNLATEIDHALPGLPEYVAQHLHTLREIGNFAAHAS